MTRRVTLGIVGVVLLAAAGGLGWRWSAAPAPPPLPVDRMEPAVAKVVADALAGVRAAPRSGEAWGRLGMAAAANGFPAEAGVCLARAEQLDPDNPRWPYLQAQTGVFDNSREPLGHLRRALPLAVTPGQRAAVHFRLALLLLEDGRLDDAAVALDALGAIEPDGPRVRLGRGLLAVARDDRPAARALLAPLADNPLARRRGQFELAALAAADGQPDLARTRQRRAAELPADLPWPDPFLDELAPFAVSRHHRLQEVDRLEAQGRRPEALALVRRIVADTPDARSYLTLGLTLTRMNEFDEAERALRRAIELGATQMQAHHFLATILFLKGEAAEREPGGRDRARALFAEALAAEDRAIALKPDDVFTHLTRGRILRHLGRDGDAIAALRAAVRCRPELADPHLFLGEALAETGNVRDAIPEFEPAAGFAAADAPRPRAALGKWRPRAGP
jgi:tetratricopeptide (TPR) repeat protein